MVLSGALPQCELPGCLDDFNNKPVWPTVHTWLLDDSNKIIWPTLATRRLDDDDHEPVWPTWASGRFV
jgi:hypothetical protein